MLEDSDDEDPDANPDLEIQIPANKVKLMIGPGGEKIKEIQKKSKCRVQVCAGWGPCMCVGRMRSGLVGLAAVA